MTYTAIIDRGQFDHKDYVRFYLGEFSEVRDILPPTMKGVYQITAANFRQARHKARLMFDSSLCISNGIQNAY